MKKLILITITALPFLFSCNNTKTETIQDTTKDSLTQVEIDHLNRLNAEKDSSMNRAVKYLNEIQETLAEIKRKEGVITVAATNKQEINEDIKTQIVDDIQLINALMEKNKAKITELRKLLKSKDIKIAELEKMIQNMALLIEEKDAEISSLKGELTNLKIEYKLLSVANMEQAELISIQPTQINRAFYCFGTSKELEENKVITKEGGFIGIGKSETQT